ncbi:hypothetical protein Hanom_Chr12g01145351 [Helianthus anomalus]
MAFDLKKSNHTSLERRGAYTNTTNNRRSAYIRGLHVQRHLIQPVLELNTTLTYFLSQY